MSELYELPDGWEWKKLDEVSRLINGRAYKKAELLEEGKYPVLRVGNFFTNTSWYYSNLELSEDKYCNNGDLLYAWSASFGPKIWNGEKSIYHYHIWKIVPKAEMINKDYLYWLLEWDVEKIKSEQGTGTTMLHVTKGSMEARSIPLPSLHEQTSIVSKLDSLFEKIDKSIDLHQKNMDEADAFMGSVLNDVFGELEEKYGVEKLKELIVMNYGKALKQADRIHGDVEVFGSNGVVGYHNEYLIDYPTIIIGRKGSVGETNLSLGKSWTIDTAYYVDIIDNTRLDLFFLFYYTKIMDISDITQKGVKPGVNRNDYLDKSIPLPPLLMQQKVVKYLDEVSEKIEKVKLVQNEKMESLKALKASILDKAFRGEL